MGREWKFYGRGAELGLVLASMRRNRWFFGAIRGRRRVGKTALVRQALEILKKDTQGPNQTILVELPDSTPRDAASVFRRAVRQAGLAGHFKDLDQVTDLPAIALAIDVLCRKGVIVAIDEFQVCLRGPLRGLPSLLKERVDRLQDVEGGGLIVLGSVQAEMHALIHDRQAPLFGRETFSLNLGPWDIGTVLEVSAEHGAGDPHRCLTLWTLFGGVPKYWRHYAELEGLDSSLPWADWAAELCESLFMRPTAPLFEEGDALLGRELNRNYRAVLREIANHGPCTHAQLRTALPDLKSFSPYLTSLVRELGLVERELPVFAKDNSRIARYSVADQFLLAWLDAIGPARRYARFATAREAEAAVLPRLRTLEGHAFERMVRQATEEASRTGTGDFPLGGLVRGYWNRIGTRAEPIEIDLVAWSPTRRTIRFGSCKRNFAKHTPASRRALHEHAKRFLSTREGREFKGWNHEYVLYSPRIPRTSRRELEGEGLSCIDLMDLRELLHDPRKGGKGEIEVSDRL